jgi:hypothetical protein
VILPHLVFPAFLLDHFYANEQFKTWFVVLILTFSSCWMEMFRTFNFIFGIWATVLATFQKIGQFSFQSSGHSEEKFLTVFSFEFL